MKQLLYIFSSILILISGIYLYLYPPKSITALDNKIRDEFFLIRGPIKTTGNVVIVDIDEKSLSTLGQWPWGRNVMAKILLNLTKAGAGIIGLDIFFPEVDTKSPAYFVKKFHLPLKNPTDTDEIFANAIYASPTILGYLFNFENNLTKNVLPNIPAIFIQKNLKKEFLLEAKGYISNIEKLQKAAYSGGFVNMIPDIDGVVRYVPLVIKYDNMIYPALSFEMFRIATGMKKVIINYSDAGVDSIQLGKLKIPTDRFGRIFVNYRGDKNSFTYISASDIYYNKFNKNLIKGKFILIGTSAAGLFDLRVTPFNNVYPGVEVHANIIDNLLKGDFLLKPDFSEILNIAVITAVVVVTALLFYFLNAIFSLAIISVLIVGYLYVSYYIFFHKGYIINIAIPLVIGIVLSLILTSINYLIESKKSKKLKKAFAKKVSPKVMEELLKAEENILEPKDKEISIFFSDIRSFTTLSEKLGDPKNVIEMLNIYMTPMVEIIIQNEGTIDKFIGDAIMAYWNAPGNVKNHPDKAVTSALLQQKKLVEVNKTIKEKFGIEIAVGMGINTNIATVGEMGSAGRADYTIIGDSVNLASRLEGLTKAYKSKIIISEFTKEKLKNKYIIRELDLVRVKGKKEPVKIFEVLDFGEKDFSKYHHALKLYRMAKFKEAKEIFTELYEKEPEFLYNLYINRCEELIKQNVTEFDGVYTFTTK